MLAGVARLAVQHFAAFVFFDMLDDSGAMIRSTAVHRDGTHAPLMQRAKRVQADLSRWPNDNPIAVALREQRVVMSQQSWNAGDQMGVDEAYGALMQSLDAVSQITAPLIARGRVLGVVTFARCSMHPPFGNAEREIAEELARRAATAIDNAQLYQAAIAASDAKSTFLASMSHELRTPLTAIIGYEELLADGITGPVTESQRQQLGRIKASAAHLLGLIDEILTFSRVEAGSERAQMDVIHVRTVLEDAAALVAPLVDDRGLVLTVELADCPHSFCTDEQKLRQILVNLLSNATKFTEHGGISLSASRTRRQMLFHVRDTGIGIPQQHLQQIFEPFWQVDQRANRRVGGTGLGLTVSRRLAQLIGGDLIVESHVGRGSTFTLQLPVAD
jgi:signal transduction histidine kinase